MNDHFPPIQTKHSTVDPCVECGSQRVGLQHEKETFRYGDGDSGVDLTVALPVWRCADCGFAYTDGDAEEIRHETVCAHLGVLAPREIRDLRERRQLSRADIVTLTGFGEASIKRWESGALIQSQSADRFLRLIDDDHVLTRLRRLANSALAETACGPGRPKFRVPPSEEQKRQASYFQLQPAAPH